MVRNAYLALFVFFLLLSPVYVFAPGLPQPADLVLAALIAILLTTFIVPIPVNKDLFLVGGLFLGHVIIVNLFWYSQLQETRFLFSGLYYLFNMGAFMVMVSLVRAVGDRFIIVCRIALAIAIVLEIAALFVLPPSAYRSAGTFNNPNQLGYWALLVSCSLLVLKRNEKLNLTDFAALCGAGYLCAASLSKAAMLSFTLLLLMAVVFQRITRPVKLMLVALAFVGVAAAVTDSTTVDHVLSAGIAARVADRLEGIGAQGDDSLAGRGYDRIWRHPEYLFVGAGEGAYWRFPTSEINPRQNQLELHSTFGTMLFAYGIVGLSLFFSLLAVVFWRAPLAHALYSLPIWMYGFTHQGLRDTMLWVFLGLVFGLAHYGRATSRRRAGLPAGDGGLPAGARHALATPLGVRGSQRSPRL